MTLRGTATDVTNPARQASAILHQRGAIEALDALATIKRWSRGQEICSEEGATEYWYRVVSGMARRYAVRPSGRRQIIGLLLPGDFFGFPARGECFAIEAVIEGTRVACYPRRRVETLADANPRIAREIREMSFQAISQLQEQILILGRTTALKKVGSFLLKTIGRLSDGRSARIVLPMSRYDIADYLGLSVETVCRSLTELKRRGVITLVGTRGISIVDPDALEEGPRNLGRGAALSPRLLGSALTGPRPGAVDCPGGQ
jgi:CRP-like cAMP-binding protein